MADKRIMLLTKIESLQARRRDAVDAYVSAGNRACWREVCETSQAIAETLRELEEMDCLTKPVDMLAGAEQ
jgi:hypothetical protein